MAAPSAPKQRASYKPLSPLLSQQTSAVARLSRREQGDHGDPDLADALGQLKALGLPPAAVVFGHMHHALRGGGLRRMARVDAATGTAFLNAATVPRVLADVGGGGAGATLRHFLVFEVADGAVEAARNVWVRVAPRARGDQQQQQGQEGQQQQEAAAAADEGEAAFAAEVAKEEEVLRTVRGADGGGVVKMVFDAHRQRWDAVVLEPGARGAGGAGAAAAAGAETVAAVAPAAAARRRE